MLKLIVLIILVIIIRYVYLVLKDQTYNLIINYVEVSSKLNIKIAHISDIHYGRFYNQNQINQLISKLNNIDVDLIVITGDLIDDKYKGSLAGLMSFKTQLKHDVPKYIILGNHDYKSGRLNEYYELVAAMGFTLLINESDNIIVNNKKLNIVGADDYLKGKRDLNLLERLVNSDSTNILLLHEPDVVDKFDVSNYALVLSGHSHGGQIKLPLNIKGKTNLGKKYVNGLYSIDETKLYVSSGVGMAGLPLRINVKPSITIINM